MTDWVAMLCERVGVALEYESFGGQVARPSRDTLIGVLAALDYKIGSDADAEDHVRRIDAAAKQRPLPEEIILRCRETCEIPVSVPVEWRVVEEGSENVIARGAAESAIRLPALPMGVHRLSASADGREWTCWLLARPARCPSLKDIAGAERVWGVTAPLYGMTDGRRAEVGDYDLLAEYASALAGRGADFVGVNPVHAMGQNPPDGVISPYSPSHRGFLNTWHVATGGGRGAASELIDYPGAIGARDEALAQEFAVFESAPERAPAKGAFDDFRAEGGEALREFALFEALASRFGGSWRDWPAKYRDRDAGAIAAFEREEAAAIRFHIWAQYRAEQQLAEAQSRAVSAGMRIGLYLDLAVGPRPDGAESWALGSPLATGATLGAPPDPLCPAGQSWGIAPLSPKRCRDDGYAGFARLLRATMRHAGMIRIDHALGLMRAFWIPDGIGEGAYVRHNLDALLAVVAIESVRSNCIVIGEDLGLVPMGLREAMSETGLYGLDVLQYMRREDGGFARAGALRSKAIVAFSTHDTATINGFFAAKDAGAQAAIGMIDEDTLDVVRADRNRARATLGDAAPVAAIHKRLAQGPAEMVAIQLDDIAGVEMQQNLPGTTTEYPNWRRRAPMTVSEIETSPELSALAADMRDAGRARQDDKETVDER